ncbi:MAG: response regulator [Phycisphaeraceae bacterium]
MRTQPLILVVDDESHILHVVSLKLKNAGYQVITAEDGEEGAAAALEHLPDMIISDYQMPYMTGLEMCLKLRGEEATRDIPAIMLTARGFSLAEHQLAQARISAVVSKPFSPREILTHVYELLGDQPQNGQENVSTP